MNKEIINQMKKRIVILPERKKELDELLKNIKEDDNPVVILVTLKPKKDNKQ